MYANLFRAAAALVIGACSLLAIDRLSLRPYRANILVARVARTLQTLGNAPPDFRQLHVARENAVAVQEALRYVPLDADLPLELAACYDILGQRDAEIATYVRVLQVHRRPEIFQDVALVEFDAARYPAAIEHFSRAVAFDYLYIHGVPEAFKADVAREAERFMIDRAARLFQSPHPPDR